MLCIYVCVITIWELCMFCKQLSLLPRNTPHKNNSLFQPAKDKQGNLKT